MLNLFPTVPSSFWSETFVMEAFSRLSLSPSKVPYSVETTIASFRSKAEITSLRSEELAVPFFMPKLEPLNERAAWIKREENGDDKHYRQTRLQERERIQQPIVESSKDSNTMAIPPGKTPISYLQELCTKRGVTPQYDLIANEGAIHEPTFLMRVTVGDTIATGKGSSKKKAKHAAAQNALNQILGIQNGGGDSEDAADSEGSFCPNKLTKESRDESSDEDRQNVNGDDCGGEGNPVGELQEFTQKKLIKPPVYEFTSEQGPPHNREFVCTVKLGKNCEKATGRSKKAAKRAAALAMLQHIKKLNAIEGDNTAQAEDSEEEEDIPLGFEPKSSYSRLKEGGGKKLPPPTPQQAQEIQRFYERVVNTNSQTGSGDGTTSMATNYCKMLQEIAEVQRFEVSYSDLNDLSSNGFRLCLVTLTTTPCAVVHGTGETTDEAHGNAAHMALQYLKMQYLKKVSST